MSALELDDKGVSHCKGADVSGEIHQLVDACRANEPSAMSRLVQQFRGQVLGLCFRMLGQWQDAEDAAQETFWRVARNLDRWDSRREFEPWLLAIAANRCRTALARRKKAVATREFTDFDVVVLSRPTAESTVALQQEIELALQRLPPKWADALRLYHSEGLAYHEIAARMGRPVGTIKTWVHRARRALLERLRSRQVLVS